MSRRRNHRTAAGSDTAGSHTLATARSMLGARAAETTAFSTSASKPGKRAARKSGNKLNVRRACGQYQRATRTPRGLARA